MPYKDILKQMVLQVLENWGAPLWRDRIRLGPASRSRPGIHFLTVANVMFRYRLVGEGSHTVVIAPDAPAVIEHYDEVVEELARDFRVVLFELPGFGFSVPSPNFTFSPAEIHDAVAQFLRALNLGPYVLAFPCVGTFGALSVASRHPALVSHVVAMQAPSFAEAIEWRIRIDRYGLMSKPLVGQITIALFRQMHVRQWFAAAVGDNKTRVESMVGTASQALRQGACYSLASAFQKYLTKPAPDFPPITQPALIIWGDKDYTHHSTDKSSIRSYLPNAREVHFTHAGHLVDLEQPKRFAEEIRSLILQGK